VASSAHLLKSGRFSVTADAAREKMIEISVMDLSFGAGFAARAA
jgi:hypothetical protein